MKVLCNMADSFIYLVSRMGVTGATGTLNSALPALIQRVKELSGNVPVAVGFGISTREHFLSVTSIADGAVIGSQLITILDDVLSDRPPGQSRTIAHRLHKERLPVRLMRQWRRTQSSSLL